MNTCHRRTRDQVVAKTRTQSFWLSLCWLRTSNGQLVEMDTFEWGKEDSCCLGGLADALCLWCQISGILPHRGSSSRKGSLQRVEGIEHWNLFPYREFLQSGGAENRLPKRRHSDESSPLSWTPTSFLNIINHESPYNPCYEFSMEDWLERD